MTRLLLWRRTDAWGAEAVRLDLDDDGLTAQGTQLGAAPEPYRLDYELDARDGFVTRRLALRASGDGWTRELQLRRNAAGRWHAGGAGPLPGLAEALDCDLNFSPLTNLLPIRRLDLRARREPVDLVTAFVSVPDLEVQPYAQRYEPLRSDRARFVDLGLFDGFTSELELDPDGLVTRYPGLADRVSG